MDNFPRESKIKPTPVLFLDNSSSGVNQKVELLTIAEVADFLKVSTPTVRRMQQQREIRFLKARGGVRFLKNDVLAYLEKNLIKPLG